MLIGQDLKQVAVVPTGLLAPGGHAAHNLSILRRMALNLLRRETTAKGGMADADAAFVLPEGHVQDPVPSPQRSIVLAGSFV